MPTKVKAYIVEKGSPHPLGAVPDRHGVNFSLFSEHANNVQLLLFDRHDDAHPEQVVDLDPQINKTFHFWHVYIRGLKAGAHYAYRADGPRDPSAGHRFDPDKVLIDPYAKGNNMILWRRGEACRPGNNLASSMRSVVIDLGSYDWEGDQLLRRPLNEMIVYEMHIGGFTKTAKVKHPGTFRGVIEKIPYLKRLGITAVELLPVFQYDDTEVRWVNERRLTNYWGYSTMAYFAPHPAYCVNPYEGRHLNEFRDMVKALHKAGIEVILDVVFNHTAEGNHLGPIFSFKGIDNSIYYYVDRSNRQYYCDYTGCGNTFNCNHPIGQKFIVECLRYWVQEMHVDGFRFDEASVLSRGEDGRPVEYPAVLWQIDLDETLADTKVIAEAWDATGLYQVGHFPGYRWAEWNGRFRDDVRRFVRGDPGLLGALAARISGSADLYQWRSHLPVNSLNFITAHDGFTLNDLVCYNAKHNDANGEGSNDGINDNLSWNCGFEGESGDPAIEALRERQIKNFVTILLLSQGVPMMVMGDEVRRTQRGNNNAYCQDNEISWFDWERAEQYEGLLRFWKLMIDFRRRHSVVQRSRYFTGQINDRGLPDISWHGVSLHRPGWDDPQGRALAFTLGGFGAETDLHVMLNSYWEALEFELPAVPGRNWFRVVDTARPSPHDILEPTQEAPIEGGRYKVESRSAAVLLSKPI
jgi:glycogen operon protein